jgi:hypothetical protein
LAAHGTSNSLRQTGGFVQALHTPNCILRNHESSGTRILNIEKGKFRPSKHPRGVNVDRRPMTENGNRQSPECFAVHS